MNKYLPMLPVDKAKVVLQIIVPIFIAVLSICVLSKTIVKTSFITDTVESLDENKVTVMEFAGATLATSLAISALPDDFASPLANTLSDMNKYFVIILAALVAEKIIVLQGTKLALLYILPLACGLYILWVLTRREILKSLSIRVGVMSLAIILVIPVSTRLVKYLGDDYMAYVNETIGEATDGADKINGELNGAESEKTIFEKLSDAFKTAISGVQDLLSYFNNVIKKSINSIAILIVTTIGVPIITLLIFKWLLKILFDINIPTKTLGVRKDSEHEESIA